MVGRLRASGLSAAPERVFGVYRVPDRFDHNQDSENRAYVEWEIAHAPGRARRRATDDVLITAFAREDHWVRAATASRACSTRTSPGRCARAPAWSPRTASGWRG